MDVLELKYGIPQPKIPIFSHLNATFEQFGLLTQTAVSDSVSLNKKEPLVFIFKELKYGTTLSKPPPTPRHPPLSCLGKVGTFRVRILNWESIAPLVIDF